MLLMQIAKLREKQNCLNKGKSADAMMRYKTDDSRALSYAQVARAKPSWEKEE